MESGEGRCEWRYGGHEGSIPGGAAGERGLGRVAALPSLEGSLGRGRLGREILGRFRAREADLARK